MSENQMNELMPEQKSDIVTPPQPLESDDASKISGGKKEKDARPIRPSFWDKIGNRLKKKP